jgi:hypothetical protein
MTRKVILMSLTLLISFAVQSHGLFMYQKYKLLMDSYLKLMKSNQFTYAANENGIDSEIKARAAVEFVFCLPILQGN